MRRALPFLGAFIYFLFMASPGLTTLFSADDMMNMHGYWVKSPWFLIRANLLVVTSFYRPMGALYYMPLYKLFGLTPLPYRLAIFVFLIINAWLLYCLGRRLIGSRLGGGLAVVFGAYHAMCLGAYLSNAVVYDVLCLGFMLGGMLWYVRVRQKERPLNWKENIVLLLLFAGAMDSKEMGVTFPAMLLLYELIWRDWRNWRPRVAELVPIALCGLLALGFTLAAMYGPGTLTGYDAYKPMWTVHQFMKTSRSYAAMLFLKQDMLRQSTTMILWAALFAIGALLRRKEMLFGAAWALVAFLPLNFLTVREGYALYISMAGLGIWAAGLVVELYRRATAKWPVSGIRRDATTAALMLVCAFAMLAAHYRYSRHQEEFLRGAQVQTWQVITGLKRLGPHVDKGSRVLFVDNPWGEGWDMYFIAKLYFNDHDLKVAMMWPGKSIPYGDEHDHFDHVFRWVNQSMVREK